MAGAMKQTEDKPDMVQGCTAPNPFMGLLVAVAVIVLAVLALKLLAVL
jgi:hypothetical protein